MATPTDPDRNELIELHSSLAVSRAELAASTDTQEELQTRVDALSAKLEEEQATRVAAETRYATAESQLQAMQTTATDQMTTIDQLQTQLRTQEGELGGLRATVDRLPTIEEELDALQAERDELAQEVKDLRARLDTIAEERQAERTKASDELATERAARAEERAELQAQIDSLKARIPVASTTEVPAKQLAQRFLDVFEELANPEPTSDRPYTAALTNLEVEAKVGVDRIEQQDSDAPAEVVLKTIDPASAMPDTLSTVRMRFGVVAKIVPRELE
jgi:chromosome segregation ATPase